MKILMIFNVVFGSLKRGLNIGVVLLVMLGSAPVLAQQFVTDDYFVMPYKSSNMMMTIGENNAVILPSMGLFKDWEVFIGAALAWEGGDRNDEDHFSTIVSAKHNVWKNERDTGGFSWSVGTGLNPEYFEDNLRTESFRDVYGVALWTLPFADDRVQLDLNPGVSFKSGDAYSDDTAVDFTYSARVAWLKGVGNWSPIAEVFGSVGDVDKQAQYKLGARWEPNDNFRFAFTYGAGLDGSDGAGVEIGIIMVTIPCSKGCSPF